MADLTQSKLLSESQAKKLIETRSYGQRLAAFWRGQPEEYRPNYLVNDSFPTWVSNKWLRVVNQIRRHVMAFFFLFNIHTLCLLGVSCVAVWLCAPYNLNLRFKVDTSFLGISIVFPLTFGITAAFKRREDSCKSLSTIKSSATSLYWAYRDWTNVNYKHQKPGDQLRPSALACESKLFEFLLNLKCYLRYEGGYESYAEEVLSVRKKHTATVTAMSGKVSLARGRTTIPDLKTLAKGKTEMNPNDDLQQGVLDGADYWLASCYKNLSELSVMNEMFNQELGCTKGAEAGGVRLATLVATMAFEMEMLRTIVQYRTPVFLRYGCGMLIHVFAILLAPYFSSFCETWSQKVKDDAGKLVADEYTCPAGYMSSAAFVIVTMLSYAIQKQLENPFEMDGLDDVFYELERELLLVTQGSKAHATEEEALQAEEALEEELEREKEMKEKEKEKK
eukprot:GDKI01004058.1.p1 GENE.GDKI01004058.1~~GDKI01004058.1.p1  ORF type:complete len:449 (-),score=141.86 GDKI01004058.1:323-1669(-)